MRELEFGAVYGEVGESAFTKLENLILFLDEGTLL